MFRRSLKPMGSRPRILGLSLLERELLWRLKNEISTTF